MRAEQEAATRDLMRLVSWVEVDESISETAGALGRRYLRSHPGIEVADLIVAALVQELDAELKATNLKHFPMIEEIEAPF